jgi:septal ring factor EnvC (AmiA/AmiB activator)
MKESTHKPTYKELEASLKKAERRARKAEASLEKSKEEKDDLKRKIKELKRLKGGSGGQELLYTLSAQYIPSKIVIHA